MTLTTVTGLWDNISYQRDFMDDLAKKLNITQPSRWYTLTSSVLKQNNGSTLLKKYAGSISKLLTTVYPEYPYGEI